MSISSKFSAAHRWLSKSLAASVVTLSGAFKKPKLPKRDLHVGESDSTRDPFWYRGGGLRPSTVHHFVNDKGTQIQGNALLRALVARFTFLNLKGSSHA